MGLPFSRQVFLMETYVAGAAYHEGSVLTNWLKAGDQLALKREPDNPYDDLAIEVLSQDGIKFGYIPRSQNPILARLMDAGKQISAVVIGRDADDPWTGIDIKVSMVEL